MRSLPFTFFLSCGCGLGLALDRGELSIDPRGIRFLLGEDILGGEAKSVPPPPEPSKPFFNVLFIAATGVLVRQSSGMRYAKSSVSMTCRFGAVNVKVLGTAPIAKSVKWRRARSYALTKICGEIILKLRYWHTMYTRETATKAGAPAAVP
jgi:hypothetical protein